MPKPATKQHGASGPTSPAGVDPYPMPLVRCLHKSGTQSPSPLPTLVFLHCSFMDQHQTRSALKELWWLPRAQTTCPGHGRPWFGSLLKPERVCFLPPIPGEYLSQQALCSGMDLSSLLQLNLGLCVDRDTAFTGLTAGLSAESRRELSWHLLPTPAMSPAFCTKKSPG